MQRSFRQVDVFTTVPYRGNPVAVVLDGQGLSTNQMHLVAHWTNLSETTFVLPPEDPSADYRVRIFTPGHELPFAGHPTLGTCHAWLENGGEPRSPDAVVQECGAGLVSIRSSEDGLAFAAPPLIRSGPVDDETRARVGRMIEIDPYHLTDVEWVVNGPEWVAALLSDPDQVLALEPRYDDLFLGVIAPYPDGSPEAFEVRAFFPKDGSVTEDPVTGSLNASLAQWLLGSGRAEAPYVVSQGTALGRSGRVHVSSDADSVIWIGGGTVTCIEGRIDI